MIIYKKLIHPDQSFVVACTCLSFVVVCCLSKILKTAVISFVNNSL